MTAPRLLVPLSFALISACAQQPTHPVELDAESECPTRLQVGQVLTLTLPSNPSTGYRWRVENP
ncbi:protease inhibitor I42 family protein, partial [Escherichia coli]|uniref:protease inhibitor I42 family protein n=1 Tax=Escherichia coli TaxID=562 RepID=UPI00215B16FC